MWSDKCLVKPSWSVCASGRAFASDELITALFDFEAFMCRRRVQTFSLGTLCVCSGQGHSKCARRRRNWGVANIWALEQMLNSAHVCPHVYGTCMCVSYYLRSGPLKHQLVGTLESPSGRRAMAFESVLVYFAFLVLLYECNCLVRRGKCFTYICLYFICVS